MQVADKNNIIPSLLSMPRVVIELGCGNAPRIKGAITIDVVDLQGVDIVADLNLGLPFLPDNCIDEIHSFHFLEHVNDLGFFMKEMWRVLKKGGIAAGTVPHFSNPYFYSDYTHKSFFGLYSFAYFSKSPFFKRGVPSFYQDIDFEITKIRLVFYSPFLFRNVLRKMYQKVFNLSRFCQEYYESSCCYTFPAHEIEFELKKN
jgi:ubiquinone/menaquinone biosynthesis C-methylase UbiE